MLIYALCKGGIKRAGDILWLLKPYLLYWKCSWQVDGLQILVMCQLFLLWLHLAFLLVTFEIPCGLVEHAAFMWVVVHCFNFCSAIMFSCVGKTSG